MGRKVPVSVNPSVVKWALDRSGQAKRITDKHVYVAKWIQGTEQPTLSRLKRFAKQAQVPFGYLLLPEPPDEQLPVPFFRTASDSPAPPSPNLIETVQTTERRQIWMREYLIGLGESPLGFVGSTQPSASEHQIAEDMRKTLGIDALWAAKHPKWEAAFSYLLDKVDKAGILVFSSGIVGVNTHRKLDPAEFRGFVLVDPYAPSLFINAADFKAAQIFTLAHELAHVWIGSGAIFDLKHLQPANSDIERHCNRIAAEFLVPEIEYKEAWPQTAGADNRFGALAKRFKVSELVVARKALDLGLLSKPGFVAFYSNYTKRIKPKSDRGGDFYKTQGRRLGSRFAVSVIKATRAGLLLYKDAYELTGLSGPTFERYATHIGLGESP